METNNLEIQISKPFTHTALSVDTTWRFACVHMNVLEAKPQHPEYLVYLRLSYDSEIL